MSDEELSIKINICDRFYPLRINSREEEGVRKASKIINERVRYYIENYSVQDKQDALAMVALELAVEQKNQASPSAENSDDLRSRLDSLEQLLDI
ncbi:cell division protein ZapA [bacterium]|nr:cell division protein ZapA [bacterium]